MNNNGVESLKTGRFREAIYLFRHAIDCLNRTRARANTNAAATLGWAGFDLDIVPLPYYMETSTSMGVSPHNTWEVYSHAFRLPRFPEGIVLDNACLADIAIVLVYNLALSYHMSGLCGMHML